MYGYTERTLHSVEVIVSDDYFGGSPNKPVHFTKHVLPCVNIYAGLAV